MKTEKGTVSAKIGAKEFLQDYDRTIFESAEDVLTHLSAGTKESQDFLCKALTYGWNLLVSAPIRNKLIAENTDQTASAVESMAKQLVKQRVKLGKPFDGDDAAQLKAAIEKVKANMAAFGLE